MVRHCLLTQSARPYLRANHRPARVIPTTPARPSTASSLRSCMRRFRASALPGCPTSPERRSPPAMRKEIFAGNQQAGGLSQFMHQLFRRGLVRRGRRDRPRLAAGCPPAIASVPEEGSTGVSRHPSWSTSLPCEASRWRCGNPGGQPARKRCSPRQSPNPQETPQGRNVGLSWSSGSGQNPSAPRMPSTNSPIRASRILMKLRV